MLQLAGLLAQTGPAQQVLATGSIRRRLRSPQASARPTLLAATGSALLLLPWPQWLLQPAWPALLARPTMPA